MAILVIQLARFGDIYQTWPVLRALQRRNPESDIHVLVRQRFQEALLGFDGGARVHFHALPTAQILEPVISEQDELVALGRLEEFLQPLRDQSFDEIINLSFSPISSYLADDLAHESTVIRGYTRHTDGYLAIPDDSSAYFYAQVGTGRSNRYHLTDIFASVANVELLESDFFHPATAGLPRKNHVAVHLGASQIQKIYPAEMWQEVLQEFYLKFDGNIIVVGAKNEAAMAEAVCKGLPTDRIQNHVGRSTLAELFEILASAKILIGADSAPMQMCSLTQTPVLNLSCAAVNFWETGPRTDGSRILYAETMEQIQPSAVVKEAIAMLNGKPASAACIVRKGCLGEYKTELSMPDDFRWGLIQALYTSTSYPEWTQGAPTGFQRLFELAELALEHLAQWGQRQQTAAKVLANIDDLLLEIPLLEPNVEPVVSWFQTERLRTPPGSAQATFDRTKKLFEDLMWIAAVYRRFGTAATELKNSIDLCEKCAPSFREFEFGKIQNEFQTLLSTFQELSRHSTIVGERTWSSVLLELDLALERRDFLEVADQLEHILVPALRNELNRAETSA